MPSTYVNDLRLEEIATGEQSGTWGVTTNTNLELIAEGFSYATVDPFDTDADKTETMADGATDPIRSLYLKVTSSATLTATRTLTIAPNTVSKVWIIENATTGSQSISISQGSGANVTIPNGDVKVIYTDGAGATAAVVDAFTDLNVGGTLTATNLAGTLTTAAQPNITSLGTLTGLTTTGDINFGDNDKAVFGAGSDLQIYHDGTHSNIKESGAGDLQIFGDNVNIYNSAGTQNLINLTSGGANTLFHSGSAKLATTATGIDVTGDVSIGDGSSTATRFIMGTGDDSKMFHNGVDTYWLNDTGNIIIRNQSDDKDIILQTDDGLGGTTTYITVDGSETDVSLHYGGSEKLATTSTGIDVTGTVVADDIGIGTSSPSSLLHIVGSTNADRTITIGDSSGNNVGIQAAISASNPRLAFLTAGTEAMRIDESGNVGIGASSVDSFLTLDKDVSTAYDPTDDNAQRSSTNTLLLKNEDGTTNSFAQLAFDLAGTGQSIARIVGINTGASTSDLAFVTEHSNTKAEKMRITSEGYVGIGTDSPATKLEISGLKNTSELRLSSTTNDASWSADEYFGKLSFYSADASGAGAGIKGSIITACTGGASGATPHMSFNVASTVSNEIERMRIDSSGNVGIGKIPSYLLDVYGQIASTGSGVGNAAFVLQEVGNNPWYLTQFTGGAFSINYNGTATANSTVVIGTSGNVGIGTTTPNAVKLHVGDTSHNDLISGTQLLVSGTSAGAIALGLANGNGTGVCNLLFGSTSDGDKGQIAYNLNSNFMQFNTNGTERMRIDSSGFVHIGASSYTSSNPSVRITKDTIGCMSSTTAVQTKIEFQNPNGVVGNVTTTGTSTSYNTSSDARLKEVTGSARGLEVINALNPVAFNWTTDGKSDEGLLAQEVQEIVPNAVSGSEKEYYQMDYSKLVTHLVAGMKEQQLLIEQLQAEVALLKGE